MMDPSPKVLEATGQLTYLIALRALYPDHDWKSRRTTFSPGFWGDAQSIKKFLTDLASHLCIKDPQDWYRVSSSQLERFPGYKRLVALGGLKTLLPKYFPEIPWKVGQLKKGAFKGGQRWLKIMVEQLFPGEGTTE